MRKQPENAARSSQPPRPGRGRRGRRVNAKRGNAQFLGGPLEREPVGRAGAILDQDGLPPAACGSYFSVNSGYVFHFT